MAWENRLRLRIWQWTATSRLIALTARTAEERGGICRRRRLVSTWVENDVVTWWFHKQKTIFRSWEMLIVTRNRPLTPLRRLPRGGLAVRSRRPRFWCPPWTRQRLVERVRSKRQSRHWSRGQSCSKTFMNPSEWTITSKWLKVA